MLMQLIQVCFTNWQTLNNMNPAGLLAKFLDSGILYTPQLSSILYIVCYINWSSAELLKQSTYIIACNYNILVVVTIFSPQSSPPIYP